MRVLILALMLVLSPLAAAKVYKWVDKDGNVHFSEQPPPEEEVAVEEVDTSAAELSESQRSEAVRLQQMRQRDGNAAQRAADSEAERRRQAAEAAQEREYQEQRAKACHSAKTNLQMLETGGRIFEKDAEGERVYLDDRQRAERLEHFRKKVKEYCS